MAFGHMRTSRGVGVGGGVWEGFSWVRVVDCFGEDVAGLLGGFQVGIFVHKKSTFFCSDDNPRLASFAAIKDSKGDYLSGVYVVARAELNEFGFHVMVYLACFVPMSEG